MAEVVGKLSVPPGAGGGGGEWCHGSPIVLHRRPYRLSEERRDDGVLFGVVTLADVGVSDLASAVEIVERGPESVLVSTPGFETVVLGYGPGDAILFHGFGHIGGFFFVVKFRCMEPDNFETLTVIFGVKIFV